MEFSTNTVRRGDYEPITVPITVQQDLSARGDYEPITVPITLVQQDLSHCKPQLSYWSSPLTQLAEVITNLLQFLLP